MDRLFAGVGHVVAANAIEIASGVAEQAIGRVHPSLSAIVRARMLQPRPAPPAAPAAPPPAAPAARDPEAPPPARKGPEPIDMKRGPNGRWEVA